jgi:5,10-methylene-tetrahydrofolate dehydrogenase/methenyl tetrahydrofolate cyclohydrolase
MTERDLLARVARAQRRTRVHGILVQMPLPSTSIRSK